MATGRTRAGDPSPRLVAALGPAFPHRGGRGLCFEVADDDAYEHGYPHLRRLVDAAIADDAAVDAAEEALDAIDPVFRIDVPRATASRYLLGYRLGVGLFLDGHRVN